MDAASNLAIEAFHFGGGVKRPGFLRGFLSGDGFRFAGTGAGLCGSLLGAFVAGLLGDKPLGNLRFAFIEFGIARTDKMEVAALESGEFGAQVCRTQLTIGKLGFERGLLLKLEGKLLIFRFGRTRVRRLQSHSLRL